MFKHLLVILLLLAPAAHAARRDTVTDWIASGDHWLSVGPMLSVTGRSGNAHLGLGVEVTYNIVDKLLATGIFTQAQWTSGHARLAGGFQLSAGPFGFEFGAQHETGTRAFLPTSGIHFAPYLTFGFASLALRFGTPFGAWDSRGEGETRVAYGSEVGIVLTLKAPLPLKGCNTGPCQLLR
ncbi:hypothetical protein [Corallococcus macrosporus]|uniref:Outer membrane protein beta-barrel domain-containing protein n=1 Tax=Corallococcus macrosporus DSM 14697 TaxID=1189310 RepID=A0A250JN92_9BACT|nr:hypothetical protein [Corallococcus macrosporus]ATB45128.1 hypothetical protein MYMAC_000712 [Corallococcus macrosporus DSM 14697]